jgi:hypothetical protein
MKTTMMWIGACALAVMMLVLVGAGCGGTKTTSMDMAGPDMGCVMNPTTHVELINACTTAQSYEKQPFFPTLAPDGTLPALP